MHTDAFTAFAEPSSEQTVEPGTDKASAAAHPTRILVYGLNFAPELTGIGRYTGDMCAWLAEQGYEVTVVTAYPYYPHWKLAGGYPCWRWSKESWHGVDVIRCPLWVPRQPTTVKRILHLLSFSFLSGPVTVLTALRSSPHIVFTIEPATFGTPWALLAAKLVGARSWLHVQDIEMAAATSLGLVSGPIRRLVRGIYAQLLRAFDRVSTISETMRCSLAALSGRSVEAIDLIPNWADTDRIYPLREEENALRGELGLNDGRLICLYSGNMGEKHGVESLAEAARLLKDRCDIHFVFCGTGAARHRVAAMTADLANVTMLPLQPEERLNELLNLADIHLLPQRGDTTSYAMPSKVGPMLASGRPIVAQFAGNSELGHVLGEAARSVLPQDAAATMQAIRELADNHLLRIAGGIAARRLIGPFSRDAVLGALGRSLAEPALPTTHRAGWEETPT
jgi:colanic acid biosynthesis glycosyl transferase WcaI